MITIKSPREIETMAAAGRIVAETLALVGRHIQPDVTTEELDRLAETFIRSHPGAQPSFKGLYDFPATLCTSINQEIVHGIPSHKRVLHDGDILSVDVGVWLEGLHADSAATFPVGDVTPVVGRLVAKCRSLSRRLEPTAAMHRSGGWTPTASGASQSDVAAPEGPFGHVAPRPVVWRPHYHKHCRHARARSCCQSFAAHQPPQV